MGNHPARLLLIGLTVCAAGCGPSEAECRKILEGNGMTDVVMVRAGDGFDFTAKQGSSSCKGHVASAGGSSAFTSSCVEETPSETSILKTDCDAQHASVCFDQARARARANDLDGAARLYAKGCELGDGSSCNDLGVAYARGQGVAKDRERAHAFYEQACKAKLDLGCLNYGRSLNAAGRLDEARPYTQAACDKGLADGCYELGVASLRGEPKDAVKALDAFKKGCEAAADPSADACGAMGVIYAQGFPPIPADLAKAEALFSSACEKGSFESCKNLGILFRDKKLDSNDKTRAIQLFTKACDGDDGVACNELGIIHDQGVHTPKDLAKAAAFYDKACALDELTGCMNAGVALKNGTGVRKDLVRAAERLEKACRGGIERACAIGRSVPQK